MIDCVFCEEILNPSFALSFLPNDWEYDDRIVFENEDAIAIPGLGPQLYPYILIVVKRHINSLTETTIKEKISVLECLEFLKRSKLFNNTSLTFFEHGGCESTHYGCLSHCHVHVISSKFNFYDLLTSKIQGTKNYDFFDISHDSIKRSYYLAGLYNCFENIQCSLSIDENFGSQFFRKLIAFYLGKKDWNWRLKMNSHYMKKIMDIIKFDSNTKVL